MKKFFYLPALTALCLCCLNSCSDNDEDSPNGGGSTTVGSIDDINPTKVFTDGLPLQVNGQSIETDSKGRVISIGNNFSIEYLSNDGRSALSTESYNIILRDNTGYTQRVFYGNVNKSGFLSYLKTESIGDSYEYVINYNDNGQISYLQEIYTDSDDGEVEKETYKWTYKDLNMTRLSYTGYDSDDKFNISYSYTGSNNSAIANKGSYIFMQAFDIDDHSYFPKTAYYAGLLGKSTKNLIVNAKWNDGDEDKYSWNLDSSGFPASVTVNYFYDGELESTKTTNFQW